MQNPVPPPSPGAGHGTLRLEIEPSTLGYNVLWRNRK
jgi:hypothetical protein